MLGRPARLLPTVKVAGELPVIVPVPAVALVGADQAGDLLGIAVEVEGAAGHPDVAGGRDGVAIEDLVRLGEPDRGAVSRARIS